MLYVKFCKNDELQKIKGNRRASDENDIMNKLYFQTGLMQFRQPEPGYVVHQLKNDFGSPPLG